MIRLSKMADYAIVLLSYYRQDEDLIYTARELSDKSRLPLPTVSKIMKALCRATLLISHRGIKGGYQLTQPVQHISIAAIIQAIDGPIKMTVCSGNHQAPVCAFEEACPMRSNWQTINQAVVRTLTNLTLADLAATRIMHEHSA